MKNARLIGFRLLLGALIISGSIGAQAHTVDSVVNLDFWEGRLGGLTAGVGNQAVVEMTTARINTFYGDGPGVWSYEWRNTGEYYESLADRHLQGGDGKLAKENYVRALILYKMGYMPGNFSPSELKAYGRFRDVMYKINDQLEFPFELVEIPFEGHTIVVHLYKPKNIDNPPLVLYTGGTDGAKETGENATQGLTSRGFAVAAFDLAGTGESMDWDTRPDSHKLHKRILDWFEKSGEFDFSRVGLIGGSFGGYYAVRMAAEDKRLKAVINHCGLVHSAFQMSPKDVPQALLSSSGPLLRSAMRRMGFDPDNFDIEAFEKFRVNDPFSLVQLGVVGTGETTIDIPLLTVNGANDAVVALDDMYMVDAAAAKGELWIIGRAAHCAPQEMGTVYPHMLDWLVEKLNEE